MRFEWLHFRKYKSGAMMSEEIAVASPDFYELDWD